MVNYKMAGLFTFFFLKKKRKSLPPIRELNLKLIVLLSKAFLDVFLCFTI